MGEKGNVVDATGGVGAGTVGGADAQAQLHQQVGGADASSASAQPAGAADAGQPDVGPLGVAGAAGTAGLLGAVAAKKRSGSRTTAEGEDGSPLEDDTGNRSQDA